jgi:hypothetical protein
MDALYVNDDNDWPWNQTETPLNSWIAYDDNDEHSWKERSPRDFSGFEIVCE